MCYKMLENILKILNKLLNLILIVCFFIFIFVRYKIFILKSSLKEIDIKIAEIKNKNAIFDIEISYLTNPERLARIYKEIYNRDYDNDLLKIEQVKNVTEILLDFNK